jgi:hypothetical protein
MNKTRRVEILNSLTLLEIVNLFYKCGLASFYRESNQLLHSEYSLPYMKKIIPGCTKLNSEFYIMALTQYTPCQSRATVSAVSSGEKHVKLSGEGLS